MTEKTVVVTLWDANAANILVKGNKFLQTTIQSVDRSSFPFLFGGFPSFIPSFLPFVSVTGNNVVPNNIPVGIFPTSSSNENDKDKELKAATNAAIRILRENMGRIDTNKMKLCKQITAQASIPVEAQKLMAKHFTMKGGAAPSTPFAPITAPPTTPATPGTTPGSTSSTSTPALAEPDYLFCYLLDSYEKDRLTRSGGFNILPIGGLPMVFYGSDAWTANYLTTRFDYIRNVVYMNSPTVLYPTITPYPIFNNFANRLDYGGSVPVFTGYGARSYSPSRERERSSSPRERQRSSSPRSRSPNRRHKEKYLKYKQKYLQLKNSL